MRIGGLKMYVFVSCLVPRSRLQTTYFTSLLGTRQTSAYQRALNILFYNSDILRLVYLAIAILSLE